MFMGTIIFADDSDEDFVEVRRFAGYATASGSVQDPVSGAATGTMQEGVAMAEVYTAGKCERH